MPPINEPDVVKWLLLFIPGFVALGVLGYFGRPTTRWSDLRWIVYSVLTSLVLEIAVRWTADPLVGSSIDAIHHPVRRAGVLLIYAVLGGAIVGTLQSWGSFDTRKWPPVRFLRQLWLNMVLRWHILGEVRLAQSFNRLGRRWGDVLQRLQPRVWTAFFRQNDVRTGFVRVELTNQQAFIAYVHQYSIDPGDQLRELVLNNLYLEQNGGWVQLPGATMYLDSGQIRSVIRVEDPKQLIAVTQYLGAASADSSAKAPAHPARKK
jgi:hypothetical protein